MRFTPASRQSRLPDMWIRHRTRDEALEQFLVDVCGDDVDRVEGLRALLQAWDHEHPEASYADRVDAWINMAYEYQSSVQAPAEHG